MNQPMSKEMQQQLAIVGFGLEVQQFLNSPIGKYLVERASTEVEANTELLKKHDILGDPAGAKTLQMEIKCAENVLYWLGDAVRTGTQLMEQMVAEERQAQGHEDGAQSGDPTGS